MSQNKKNDYFGALNEKYINPYETGEIKIVGTFYVKYVKRTLDIIISLAAILVTFPVNIVIGLVTFLDLGNPIFFSHERPGLGEKPFKMFKFRNMTLETDAEGKLLPPGERVTKIGKFFRKTSLDELLQFWLILCGKMSIIGPRPLLMSYLPRYDIRQHKRHAVKPGLECPMGYYSQDETSWEQRIENDIWYVENVSFKTDLIMMLRLVKLIFNPNRSKIRSEKIDVEFKKPDAG